MPNDAFIEVGAIFGKLIVIEPAGRIKNREMYYRARCECGTEKVIRGITLRAGESQSCGCAHHERRDAKAAGKSRYFTGRPCKQGHIAERQTINGSCVECFRIREMLQESKIRKNR